MSTGFTRWRKEAPPYGDFPLAEGRIRGVVPRVRNAPPIATTNWWQFALSERTPSHFRTPPLYEDHLSTTTIVSHR
jgi:hypothetical protein